MSDKEYEEYEKEFTAAIDAVDEALQKIDASVEVAVNAFGYLTALTISEFPKEEQQPYLKHFITTLQKNVELFSEENEARVVH